MVEPREGMMLSDFLLGPAAVIGNANFLLAQRHLPYKPVLFQVKVCQAPFPRGVISVLAETR
jgi:hypothetical protein